MRVLAVLVAACVAVPALALSVAAPTASADTPSTGPILFQDDFTGPAGAAPGSAWYDYSACTYDGTAAFGKIQCGDNETLDGSGNLRIPATPDAGSAIRTRFTFQYGTMSARLKMPSERGSWPAFWSLNNNPAGGAAAAGAPVGEVDAVEGYTTFKNVAHAVGHTWAGGSDYHSPDNRCPAAENIDVTAFHTYSAKIEPGKVTFYLDGVQCGGPYAKTAGKPWGFGPDVTRGNWMILQNAVGGAAGQNPPGAALGAVVVDRVEVRALNTEPTTSTPTPTPTPTPSPTPSPTPAPAPAVVSGAGYQIVTTCGGKVLEVPGGATQSGTRLTTSTWSAAGYQKWTISAVPGGFWKLKNVATGRTANVAGNSTTNGSPIIQYSDVGGPNAEWQITAAAGGGYLVKARSSGKYLEVAADSTADGAPIVQNAASGRCGQNWRLVKL